MTKLKLKQLTIRQNLPLLMKVGLTKTRIKDWYKAWDGEVYVSFSGGKDSTVLLHIARNLFPEVPAVFVDSGLEYPEIRQFVKSINNVVWLKPKISFNKVVEKYGYPVVSKMAARAIHDLQNPTEKNKSTRMLFLTGIKKNKEKTTFFKLSDKWKNLVESNIKISDKCCDIIKKGPFKKYEKETGRKPFLGNMASDSRLRKMNYLKTGCNNFDSNRPVSMPLGFWRETDVWNYIKKHQIPYSKIYDIMKIKQTGCMFCMFGVHLEKEPNRFQQMFFTHPKHWNYCINKLGCGKVLDFIEVPYKPSKLRQLILF